MKFLLECYASELYVSDGDTLALELNDDHATAVRLDFHVTTDADGEPNPFVRTVTTGHWEPTSDVLALAQSLMTGELPKGHEEPKYWVGLRKDEFDDILQWVGIKERGSVPPRSSLSTDVREFIDSADRALSDATRRCVNLVRWRYGIQGPHEPLRRRLFLWSVDESKWGVVPFDIDLSIWVPNEADFTGSSSKELQTFLSNGLSEPLARTLWREAWEQRVHNPRSALVIGMAAAEIGFKQFVAELVPKAAWLIEEVQAPRIDELLRNYLPRLIEDLPGIQNRGLPRAEVITPIRKANEARNTIVHKSATAKERHEKAETLLSPEGLEKVLLAVSDLLWFLDYYRGHEWALNHVRKETIQAWEALPQSAARISPTQ